MFVSAVRPATVLFGVAVAVLVSVACGDSRPAGDSRPSSRHTNDDAVAVERESIKNRVEAAQAFWLLDSGADVDALARASVGAAVVRVLEREDLTDPKSLPEISGAPIRDVEGRIVDRFAEDDADAVGPQKDPTSADPTGGSPSMSRYRVEVIEELGGAGDPLESELWILQSGGVKDGIAYELQGDPVLEVGATYVTFLQEDEVGLWSTPWGRFTLDDSDETVPVADDWAQLGVVEELRGRSLEDLRTLLQAIDFGER